MKTHIFLIKSFTLLVLLFTNFVLSFSREIVIYETDFESEDYVATTFYKVDTCRKYGPQGMQWGIRYGTISSTNPVSETKSIQMRGYDINNLPFAYTDFELKNVNKIEFSAKRSGTVILKVQHKFNDGDEWIGDSIYALTTSACIYNYNICNTNGYPIGLKFTLLNVENKFPSSNYVGIDEIFAYKTIENPKFSVRGGAHVSPFELYLSASNQCSIYYTIDGTDPSQESMLKRVTAHFCRLTR